MKLKKKLVRRAHSEKPRAVVRDDFQFQTESDEDMLRLGKLLILARFGEDLDMLSRPDGVREILSDIDWYAGPVDGRWTVLGAGDCHPVAGAPGSWDTYMWRGDGVIKLIGFDRVHARMDRS